jgi:DNA-binding NtrC family response regulator
MYAQSVLIADPNPAVWQELCHTLSSWLPEKQFGFCRRPNEVFDRVDKPSYPYDVVISSAGFAESENCLLLNGLKCLSVPLVITAGLSTLASSRRVLKEGAFGVIRLPVDGKRASQVLSWATGLKDILRRTTVYRDMLKDYHERLDACQQDVELEEVLRRCHVNFESTYDRWKETVAHIEQSVQRLERAAVVLEDEARLQAYVLLCELEVTKAMCFG